MTEPEGLQRLPPGRHGLPREFVIRNQRDRITCGVIATVAREGFRDATITQIAAAAGVSRRTFYAHFSSKEQCFLSTFDLIDDHLCEAMGEADGDAGDPWPEMVRARLAALLEVLAANPDLVTFAMDAPTAAGGELAERQRLHLERVVGCATEGCADADQVAAPTPGSLLAIAGGMAALLVGKVAEGEGERLDDLLPDVVEIVLSPYLGHERAASAARA